MEFFSRKNRGRAAHAGQATRGAAQSAPVAPAPPQPVDLLLRSATDVRSTAETLRAAGASDADLPWTHEVLPGVVAVLGIDEHHGFSILSERIMADLRLDPEMAYAEALARLSRAATGLKVEGGGDRYRVRYLGDPDLTASFMLIAHEWIGADAISGDPVFAAGSRVMLHMCGSEDVGAIAGLQALAEALYRESVDDPAEHGRPLTPALLTVRDGELHEF